MSTDLGDRTEDSIIHFMWSTNAADGSSITRAVDGTISVYKDDNLTQSVAGITDTEDFDSLTGIHMCKIDTSADAFYAAAEDYTVVLSGATIDGKSVNTVLAVFSIENRFMRGTDSAALAATALTNVMWTDAKAGALTDWLDGERLDLILDARAPSAEYDGQFEDVRAILGDGGDIFYVSKTGDNSDGTTWAKAMTTIDAAVALCTANHCDRIYVGCGTYDETSATAGVTCDVAGIKIIGAMPGVVVNNTNTTNGSRVLSITADDVWLQNLFVTKGETTSDNVICIEVNGAGVSVDIRDVTIAVEKANHTGIKFDGGAVGCGYVNGPMSLSYIYSAAGVGTGIEAANCNNCVAIDAQFHTLDTGIKFTGGANCHDNMISPHAMISSCTTGITLNAGCVNNMLSAIVLNCTDEYEDNSGNTTNKTDGSLTYILDDIKTHVQNGFDGVEGAGFDTLTDSLEALRNRGDAAWVTATGFMTTDAIDEPPQGPPPATPTPEQVLAYMYFRMMNKNEETTLEHSVYDVAGTTKVIKADMSDVAGVLTKGKFESGA